MQQLLDDILHILADIAGFGQRGRVGDGEGYVQQSGESFRQQGLAAAGWSYQQDVALAEFHVLAAPLLAVAKSLVMVINGYGKHLFGALLADDILVEYGVDLLGYREMLARRFAVTFLDFLANYVIAKVHALVTDKHRRTGYQLAHLVLALAAEGAIKQLAAVGGVGGFLAHSAALRPLHRCLIILCCTMMSFKAICNPRGGQNMDIPRFCEPCHAARPGGRAQ